MRVARWFVLALVAVTPLAGCKQKPAAPTAEADTAPAGATPHRGGYAVLPSNEPRYLNPVLETRYNLANPLLFEGLVGMSSTLEPIPLLAASWEQAADGTSLTFHLRPGVKWSDGQPLTSKDVAFTFQAIEHATVPTIWNSYFANVDRVDTPDAATVVVKYKRPYAPALVTWTVGIIPEHVFGGGDLSQSRGNQEPIGSGPYKLGRWEEGKRIILEANPGWWNGHANLDTVELRFDLADPLAALDKDELDFAEVPDTEAWVSRTQVPEFRNRYEVATVVGSLFRLMAWNTERKPFDDRRVRVALAMALDRPRVVEDVLLGEARELSAPFFPTMYGADPSIAPYPFDLAAAVKALDDSGHPKGATGRFAIDVIAIRSQDTPANEEMFAIFRRDLDAIGIALKVEYMAAAEFEKRVVARDFDGAFFGWLPDVPDPDPSALLHSSQIKVGQNFAGYSNPAVDKLLEAAVATPDKDERKALYRKLHALIHADEPYTVLYAPYDHYAWSRRLRGVLPEDVGSPARFPGLAGWWTSGGIVRGVAKPVDH